MGFIGKEKIDAYIKCVFKKKKMRTQTIVYKKDGEYPNWNKEFWFAT